MLQRVKVATAEGVLQVSYALSSDHGVVIIHDGEHIILEQDGVKLHSWKVGRIQDGSLAAAWAPSPGKHFLLLANALVTPAPAVVRLAVEPAMEDVP